MFWQNLNTVCHYVRQIDFQAESYQSHLKTLAKEVTRLTLCGQYEHGVRRDRKLEREQLEPSRSFTNLIRMVMSRATSEPHDKIYGIIGMAVDVDARTYPISHEKHFRQAYIYATKYIIDKHTDLEILRRTFVYPAGVMKPPYRPQVLPSWTPDFRLDVGERLQTWQSFQPPLAQHGPLRLYNATGSSRAKIVLDDSDDLCLRGVLLGVIKDISDSDGCGVEEDIVSDAVRPGGEWSRLATSLCPSDCIYQPTGEPIHIAYGRLLIRDYLPEDHTRAERMARPQSTLEIPGPIATALHHGADGEKYLKTDKITERIAISCRWDRLALLTSGHMGLVHQSCAVDDEVWLLMGGDMPFILHPLATDKYEFKGEAYIHGVMEGEHLIQKYKPADDLQNSKDWLDNLSDKVPFPTEEVSLI